MPLTTKQMEYLALAWQCFETEPKVRTTLHASRPLPFLATPIVPVPPTLQPLYLHPQPHPLHPPQLNPSQQINYTRFAEVAGLKNARSAAELMRVAKNKLKAEYGSMSTGMQTANTPTRNAATSVTGKKRARKAAGEGDEGNEGHADGNRDEDDEESGPMKKVKGGAFEEGKGVKAEVAVGSGDEDLDLGFQ
ncbi:hypothetical protein B0A54_05073 [Friedmanniomyces endolithicus]|uniref:Uncharacterized protein n=2 Tax=Friedmanniomyces endolithicus TaxID=329885 RepID=A0A4U0V6D1_9PEZI|nr:hypothetical protein B0A54_05073 [Friedmanniomyces endolithicus]